MRNRRRQPLRKKNVLLFFGALFLLGIGFGVCLRLQAAGEAGALSPSPAASPDPPSEPPSPALPEPPVETPSPVPPEPPAVTPPPAPPEPPVETPMSARETLESMTLREKVCQMFMVFASDLAGQERATRAGASTRAALEKFPVGGVLYDAGNMVDKEQVRTMLETTQSYSRIPLIFTCDEEGGRVGRLMRTVGTTRLGPMLSYADLGPETARTNARTIAQDMASLGFNTDLAPVADVWSNPANTVIGDRAYSSDFSQAAQLIPAAVEGFHAGGVACTLKHFPGHGDTMEDSHNGMAYVNKSADELRAEELAPFRAGISAGADMVMVGHLTVSDLDGEPAPFSYKLVTELLREELGFQGVVITDSLKMKAITNRYSSGEAAVKAVQAGVDLLLCPADLEESVEALLDAVERGELSETRIDESVLRILEMKELLGIL